MKKSHATLLLMVLLARPGVAEEPAKTLHDCIRIALENQPSLKAASATIEAGHQRVRQAASSYLPQINALYAVNRRQSSPAVRTGSQTSGIGTSSPTFNFYNTGFNFTQLLFDFGQNLNSIRAAQASEESLEADRSTQQDTVVLNVKQGYFNVLATRRLQAVADETVRQNRKHVEQAEGRFKVGLAPKFDVTQAQVQLATAELNQLTARNNVAIAWETLRNALGLTGPLDFDIVDNFDAHTVLFVEEQALTMAYDRRPELRSIQAQELSADEQIKSLQKTYLPNITGNGNYYWSGSDYPLQDNWNVGASVNLSIFNGGLTTAQVAEQRANLENLKFNEEVTRQSIALEVRQAVLNLEQAAKSIRVSEKGLQQARENLDLAEGRYNTGVGNIIELTDAQASYTSAEASHVQSLYNYQTALAAVEKATAQPVVTE